MAQLIQGSDVLTSTGLSRRLKEGIAAKCVSENDRRTIMDGSYKGLDYVLVTRFFFVLACDFDPDLYA